MRLLNCLVTESQWSRWQQHIAPSLQPFFLPDDLPLARHLPRWTTREFRDLDYPLSLRDTFTLYFVSAEAHWVLLLDENTFGTLDPTEQGVLLAAQRNLGRGAVFAVRDWAARLSPADLGVLRPSPEGLFVLWPGVWKALSDRAHALFADAFVCEGRLPHRGGELRDAHRARLDAALPGVRALAGTFAPDSGANCLSTVVAAFGVPGVADVWLHGGPFERWLTARAEPGGTHDEPGTVLVWRDAKGQVQHAAVALGEGWALQKDAQGWYAPRQVIALSDLLARWHRDSWTVEAWTGEAWRVNRGH